MVASGLGFRYFLLTSALAVSFGTAAEPVAPSNGAWEFLRTQFYGDKPIGELDETWMRVDAPRGTPDPAATPITLHFGKDAAGSIRKVRVIIDHNPSPIAATIGIEPGVAVDEMDLRLRIDRSTSVRAIAETSDGRLEMRSAWVEASGGCSAPPSPGGEGKTGDIRFRTSPDGKALQVSIRHPNHSGFQIDPVSGDTIPPHYVSHIVLRAGERKLLDVDAGISISENPTLRIVSETPLGAPLTLDATDSKDAAFTATWNGVEAHREPAAP